MEFINITAVAATGAACLPVLLRNLPVMVAIATCLAIALSG